MSNVRNFDEAKIEQILKQNRSDEWHQKGVWPIKFGKALLAYFFTSHQEEVRRLTETVTEYENRLTNLTAYADKKDEERRAAQVELETLRTRNNSLQLVMNMALQGKKRANEDDFGMPNEFNAIRELRNQTSI